MMITDIPPSTPESVANFGANLWSEEDTVRFKNALLDDLNMYCWMSEANGVEQLIPGTISPNTDGLMKSETYTYEDSAFADNKDELQNTLIIDTLMLEAHDSFSNNDNNNDSKMENKNNTNSNSSSGSSSLDSLLRSALQGKAFIRYNVPENDAEACLTALKYENFSAEEFDSHWKACAKYRLNDIKITPTSAEVFQQWHFYKKPYGYGLIDIDYEIAFGNGELLLNNWEKSFPNIVAFLQEDRHIKDRAAKALLEKSVRDICDENFAMLQDSFAHSPEIEPHLVLHEHIVWDNELVVHFLE
ncbi:hypothetical protein JTB14_017547 [Gonioctena quinquepunctata]|nr:hypothetical protein JTB14_017547 [Gonioctena quinquepunctata]